MLDKAKKNNAVYMVRFKGMLFPVVQKTLHM